METCFTFFTIANKVIVFKLNTSPLHESVIGLQVGGRMSSSTMRV